MTGWIGYRWSAPVYYDYGPGGTVYYEGDTVYVNGDEYGTAEEYYQDVEKLAESAPELDEKKADETEWLPLGVFAITSDNVSASHMYLQLAVSKEGIISGTFYNETTGAVHPVEGIVDEKTQRAVWKAADGTNSDVVMETGVFNLTRDEAELLVHFGPEKTQTWTLVRLEESQQPQMDQDRGEDESGENGAAAKKNGN